MTGEMWGADTSELEQLARQVLGAATQLEDMVGSLSTALASTSWRGPDADGFQSDWHGLHARSLSGVVENLREVASKLDFEAHQQLTSSAAGGGRSGLDALSLGSLLTPAMGLLAGAGVGEVLGRAQPALSLVGHGLAVENLAGPGIDSLPNLLSRLGDVDPDLSDVTESMGDTIAKIGSGLDTIGPGLVVVGGVLGAVNLGGSAGPALIHNFTRDPYSGATVDAGLKSTADVLAMAAAATVFLPEVSVPLGLAAAGLSVTMWLDPRLGNQVVSGVKAEYRSVQQTARFVGSAWDDVMAGL